MHGKNFQSLVFVLTQLRFGQWSSLPFYQPSLIVQLPAWIFHFLLLRMIVKLAYREKKALKRKHLLIYMYITQTRNYFSASRYGLSRSYIFIIVSFGVHVYWVYCSFFTFKICTVSSCSHITMHIGLLCTFESDILFLRNFQIRKINLQIKYQLFHIRWIINKLYNPSFTQIYT